jgi:hypothetical protein
MASPSELVQALVPVVGPLDLLGVRYCIGGSVASSVHGAARSTLDVDLVAEMSWTESSVRFDARTNPPASCSPAIGASARPVSRNVCNPSLNKRAASRPPFWSSSSMPRGSSTRMARGRDSTACWRFGFKSILSRVRYKREHGEPRRRRTPVVRPSGLIEKKQEWEPPEWATVWQPVLR